MTLEERIARYEKALFKSHQAPSLVPLLIEDREAKRCHLSELLAETARMEAENERLKAELKQSQETLARLEAAVMKQYEARNHATGGQ